MRHVLCAIIAAAVLAVGTFSAPAQNQPRGQQPPAAAARPYKTVAITPPQLMADAGFDAFRKQLGDIAQRKDRAALAPLVVAQGFFWTRDKRESADKRKSGLDNLAIALGLNGKGGVGWDILFSYTDDPTVSPSPARKDAYCTPGDPAYKAQEFDDLLKATQTEASDWGYPLSTGVEVRAKAHASTPVIDTLGLAFVRISPERAPSSPTFIRIITPAGNAGYVSVDVIGSMGNDQICYVKDAGGWKIGGYIGGGESQ